MSRKFDHEIQEGRIVARSTRQGAPVQPSTVVICPCIRHTEKNGLFLATAQLVFTDHNSIYQNPLRLDSTRQLALGAKEVRNKTIGCEKCAVLTQRLTPCGSGLPHKNSQYSAGRGWYRSVRGPVSCK